jgi:hypothetical protein
MVRKHERRGKMRDDGTKRAGEEEHVEEGRMKRKRRNGRRRTGRIEKQGRRGGEA